MSATPPPAPNPSVEWTAVKALFDEALALPPEQRQGYLLSITVDADVLREVQSLLAHSTGQASAEAAFLDDGAAALITGPGAALDADGLGEDALGTAPELGATGARRAGTGPRTSPRTGLRLGPWQLGAELGTGGMGEVFRAQRADGAYDAAAAVKILKRGMDSASVLARFAQEQRALARLNHPHIARLFDAGLTPDGLPYFVMELVEGRAIDQAARGLSLEARLRLFLQLTDAVAHAHRQLLVHRDLKPSNVLVDGQGQVKLLDFGIAKAIDPGQANADAAASDITQGGQRPYTPNYASPEQVRGEPVGTGTDIYSLGVLLYQLLTGLRPTGREATTPAAAARSVLDEQPTRPSALSPGLIADPLWLATRKRLVGDLDNILLKALEKPIERRYASVDALAADVRAHLAGFAVSARAPSSAYLTTKFIGRHKATSLASALALIALIGGLGASAWHGQQVALARDDARRQLDAIKRITTDLVFRFGDTVTTLPGGAKAQEAMLKQTLASLQPALTAAPDDLDLVALVASVLGRLAELQGNTTVAAPERAAEASATVARALALGEQAWARQRGDWRFASWHVRTLVVQAQLLRGQGKPAEGLVPLTLAIERCDEALATQPPPEGRAHLMAGRGGARLSAAQLNDQLNMASLGRPQEALRLYALAEADLRALLAEGPLLDELDRNAVPGDPSTEAFLTHQIGTILGGRALVQLRLEDLPAARREAEAALVMRRANVQREPRNVVWRDGLMVESNTLALALLRLGEHAAALDAASTSWQTATELAQQEGPQSKWAGSKPFLAPQYGRALAGVGRHAEAVVVYDLGLAMWDGVLAKGPNNNAARRAAWLRVQRAKAMAALGQGAAAQALVVSALDVLRPLTGDAAVGRDASLALAEGLAALAVWQPARAAGYRQEALAALGAAAALRPLGADQLAVMQAMR